MSYDGKIPPSGGASPAPGTKLPEQTEDKVTGRFSPASGGSRDVSVKEGKTHIPAATDNGPKGRPLDEWEIKVEETEQLFFAQVADIMTMNVSAAEKSKVKEELKKLHTCMHKLLNEYNQRILELAANDRITEKHFQRIQTPMIRVFQSVRDKLVRLEKALAPKASKTAQQKVADILPIAQIEINQAKEVLTEAKVLLEESTLPEVKAEPVPRPVLRDPGVPTHTETAQKKSTHFFKKKADNKSTLTTPPLEKVSNAHLAASEIGHSSLKKQVGILNKATSPTEQKQALEQLHSYALAQRERFNRLYPLLQAVATKCDFEQRNPPVECQHFYAAMEHLNKTLLVIQRKALSEEYISAVKELDTVLATLEPFDQELPPPLWHSLTETAGQPESESSHFLNLMCRQILNEETGPLSERESLIKFTDICDYLAKVQGGKLAENTDAETLAALRNVVGEGFSSPKNVRVLMAQAHTLEEVRAVGFQLVNWTGMKSEYLTRMCARLEAVDMDLENGFEAIPEGRKALNNLALHFTSGTERVAGEEAASRLSQLESEIKKAVEQIVEERIQNSGPMSQFQRDRKVCEKLQQELSQELGDVATIELRPGAASGEVLRIVKVKLTGQDSEKINATLNGQGQHASKLRELLLSGNGKDLLETDTGSGACRWVPHPKAMIRQFADDFVSSFETYQRAVDLAQEQEPHINHLVVAREKAESAIERLRSAIPTVAQLKHRVRRRSERRNLVSKLATLTTRVASLNGKPLKHLPEETTLIQEQVVEMLKKRQLGTSETIKVLEPLYQLHQTARGATPAALTLNQPLSPEIALRTEKLANTLIDLEKKYQRHRFWHRLTRSKRLKAVETTKALVTVCEGCPHAPIANARMLDRFIEELEKVKSKHPDYLSLVAGLREYADHLHKNSTPVSFELASGKYQS